MNNDDDGEEDPFSMFGDDKEEEEVEEHELESFQVDLGCWKDSNPRCNPHTLGTDLQQLQSLPLQLQHSGTRAPTDDNADSDPIPARLSSSVAVIEQQQQHTVTLPWRSPLYQSPMITLARLDSTGGGRGYIAQQDLPAGTLILLESALCRWPEQQLGRTLGLVSVLHIIERVDLTNLHELEYLHPTKAVVDNWRRQSSLNIIFEHERQAQQQVNEMMDILTAKHSNDPSLLQEIVQVAAYRRLTNADGTVVSDVDCLRLLLALRYNGMQSGLYLHVAMLNHSDRFNCVKFVPPKNNNYGDDRMVSEVWTTRPVQAGEILTISYLPEVRSHATRRYDIWEQHRFDIDGVGDSNMSESSSSSTPRSMELIQGIYPFSSVNHLDDTSPTRQVEKTTDALRGIYQDLLAVPSPSSFSTTPVKESNRHRSMQELELTLQELVVSAIERLGNSRHILLIPILELHVDSMSQILQHNFETPPPLNFRARTMLLSRMVVSLFHLQQLQMDLYGINHFDLARSSLDLAQSIEELIAQSPRTLLHLSDEQFLLGLKDTMSRTKIKALSSATAWSRCAYNTRKEYDRIRKLYPINESSYS